MRKIYILPSLLFLGVLLQSGVKNSFIPPGDYTGATGSYCTSCHGSNPLNSGGGSVTVTGLPATGGYVPGQTYTFSVTVTHGTANRTRWGFSIAARSTTGAAIGTFGSSNPEARVNENTSAIDQELSHYNATIKTASASYTFNNLTWTAPVTPPSPSNTVTFFYVGNAANGGASPAGDFIYSGSTTIALPIELKDFSAIIRGSSSVLLQWTTASETNSDYFEIEKSIDNQFFYAVGKIYAAGNSGTDKKYNYTDRNVTSNNRPVFYRLKLMDKDGKFKLSKTVTVTPTGGNAFVENVFPSMIKAGALVTADITSGKAQPVQIQLFDITGKLLQTNTSQLITGSNIIKVRMPDALPQQWIFAKFTAGGVSQTVPLVVHQ